MRRVPPTPAAVCVHAAVALLCVVALLETSESVVPAEVEINLARTVYIHPTAFELDVGLHPF
jgi:hypothetical protein